MANALAGPVKLPPDFDMQSQNAASEWKFWKTTFDDYLIATGQNESEQQVKLSILRNIIRIDAARIMSTFNIPDNEEDKYKYMVQQIEKYINPRVNECFERYTSLKRVQKEGEPFEHFLTDCRHVIKSCNYNTVDPNESSEDKALRDKIVMGIKDSTTREALLRIDQLTLEKAINFCRTSEQSKQQSMEFQEEQAEINYVNKRKQKSGKNKQHDYKQKLESDNKKIFKCKRCNIIHGPRECPAFRKKCNKCGLENHFAIACKEN